MMRNPYVAGSPVGNTSRFVGRSTLLNRLESAMRDPGVPGAILWGQRRIGKTSILQHFGSQLSRSGWVPAFIDMNERGFGDLTQALLHVVRSFCAAVDCACPEPEEFSMTWFEQVWRPLALTAVASSQGVVLLIDEFDTIMSEPEWLQKPIMSFVRQLIGVNPPVVKCVLVSGCSIASVSKTARTFLKNFQLVCVTALTRSESDTLTTRSETEGSLKWTETARARVWYWAAGHPLLTQALCAQVWENICFAREDGSDALQVGQGDVRSCTNECMVDDAIVDVLINYGHSLSWLWDGLSTLHQTFFVILSSESSFSREELFHRCKHTIPQISSAEDLVRHVQQLVDWGLVSFVNETYAIRPELLRRWIIRYGVVSGDTSIKTGCAVSTGVAMQSLAEILQAAFSSQEFLNFVRLLPEGNELVLQLSERDGVGRLVWEFLPIAQRYGILRGGEFWAILQKARPRLQKDIASIEIGFRAVEQP